MDPNLSAAAPTAGLAAAAAAHHLHHPLLVVLLVLLGPHLQVHAPFPRPTPLPRPRCCPLPSLLLPVPLPLPPQHPRQGLPLVRSEFQPTQPRHRPFKLGQRLIGRLVQPVQPLQLRLVHLGPLLPLSLLLSPLGGGGSSGRGACVGRGGGGRADHAPLGVALVRGGDFHLGAVVCFVGKGSMHVIVIADASGQRG